MYVEAAIYIVHHYFYTTHQQEIISLKKKKASQDFTPGQGRIQRQWIKLSLAFYFHYI